MSKQYTRLNHLNVRRITTDDSNNAVLFEIATLRRYNRSTGQEELIPVTDRYYTKWTGPDCIMRDMIKDYNLIFKG